MTTIHDTLGNAIEIGAIPPDEIDSPTYPGMVSIEITDGSDCAAVYLRTDTAQQVVDQISAAIARAKQGGTDQ